jgi:hypothetical protein
MYDYHVLCLLIDLTKLMPNDITLLLRHLPIHCPQGREVDYDPMHSLSLPTAWRVKIANQRLQPPTSASRRTTKGCTARTQMQEIT